MRSLLPAPARVVSFLETALRAPLWPEARAELDAMVEQGMAACPRCALALDITGYRKTETSFMVEEVLRCPGCGTELLLSRELRA